MDDHAIVRQGIKTYSGRGTWSGNAGEAENGHEALRMVRDQTWDLVILDINLPGQSGLEVLIELHYQYPKLPIMIMSMYSEEQYAVQAFKAGAVGYLNKQSVPKN